MNRDMGSPLRCLVQTGSGPILSLLWWALWALLHVCHLPESGANAKINPWITDWLQYVPRLGLQQFSVALSNNLNNISVCCFESLGHQIIIMQWEYCFLVCYILYKSDWTILYPCEFCPTAKDKNQTGNVTSAPKWYAKTTLSARQLK